MKLSIAIKRAGIFLTFVLFGLCTIFVVNGTAQTLIDLAHQVRGTLPAANLPNPTASTIGGVESIAAVAHNFLTSISTSGVPAQVRPVCADLSDSAASCATDATNASNISSGTLGAGRLPNPSSSTLGGIQSIVAVAHNFLTSISTSGVPAQAQPACGDLSDAAASCNTNATNASNISSGTLPAGRMPAHTGDVTSSAGSVALTLANSGVSAGSCGDATHSCSVTFDAKGRATAQSNNVIAAGASAPPIPGPSRFAYVPTGAAALTGDMLGDHVFSGACSSIQSPTTGMPTVSTVCQTNSTANNVAGIYGYPNWRTGQNLFVSTVQAISQVTSIRFRVGIGDPTNVSVMLSTATPTQNFADFRFDTSTSDTHFICESMDNSTMTTADSGITPSASTDYTFQIQFNDATPNIVYSINGSTVCTLTTHLPSANTNLRFFTGVSNLATGAMTDYVGLYYLKADH